MYQVQNLIRLRGNSYTLFNFTFEVEHKSYSELQKSENSLISRNKKHINDIMP